MQELEETVYWLEMLKETKIANPEYLAPLLGEANELTAILVTSAKTLKQRIK